MKLFAAFFLSVFLFTNISSASNYRIIDTIATSQKPEGAALMIKNVDVVELSPLHPYYPEVRKQLYIYTYVKEFIGQGNYSLQIVDKDDPFRGTEGGIGDLMGLDVVTGYFVYRNIMSLPEDQKTFDLYATAEIRGQRVYSNGGRPTEYFTVTLKQPCPRLLDKQ